MDRMRDTGDGKTPLRKQRLTVRWRLTLWYALILSLSFAFVSIIIDRLVAESLYDQVDRRLSEGLASITSVLEAAYKEDSQPSAAQLLEEIQEFGGVPPALAMRLSLRDGRVYTFNSGGPSAEVVGQIEKGRKGFDSPVTVAEGTRSWRLRRVQGTKGRDYEIMMLSDLALVEAQMRSLRRTLFISLPLILLFAAISGYFLAGRALRPVVEITAQARHIEAHGLDQRLDVRTAHDEFGQLAEVLNDLFSRLEAAFKQQRQFLSDAAHELRTPAAILRSQADVALERPRSAEEYASTLASMRLETEHLSAIVDDLLLIARAESAQLQAVKEPVDLSEIADEACRAVRPLAQAKSLHLQWQVGDEVSVPGDPRLLRRALVNLLSNSVKYTPADGTITIGVFADHGSASLRVTDTGRAIPAHEIPRIFDRFYRGAGGVCSETDGAGLGLAIVKMIADLHRGQVTVSSTLGQGSTFTLTLPGDSPQEHETKHGNAD